MDGLGNEFGLSGEHYYSPVGQAEMGGKLDSCSSLWVVYFDFPTTQIVNFPVTQKTIHLSYHNGEHYSSVRPREGNRLPSVSEASSDVASKSKSSEKKSPPVEPPANVSPEVKKKKNGSPFLQKIFVEKLFS